MASERHFSLTRVQQRLFRPSRQKFLRETIAPGLKDRPVWDAFCTIDRRDFVPDEAKKYTDENNILQNGSSTISEPLLMRDMLVLLELQGMESVLEIGTGSGWTAAMLGQIAKSCILSMFRQSK